MAKLPDKFSVAKAVEFISSGGHKVRPVDVNGFALDDGTQQYSVAHPVVEVDSTGTVTTDSTQIKSTHKKVTSDPKGTPVIIVGGDGTSLGTVPGGGGGTPISGITYDTAIGNGVGTDGFASLPLNTGARRFYVNSSTGSDSNTVAQAQSAATPWATINHAYANCTNGLGDQILLAEGLTYSTFPMIGGTGGASALYPFVIQSYNPADPTNEAKFGRATGSNRAIILTAGMTGGFIQGSGVQKYRALRGIKFDAQNTANATITILDAPGATPDYTLIENCEFAQVQLTVQASLGTINKFIFRHCAAHGAWGSHRAQGLFADHIDGLTIEDSIFWHCGWKEGANRSDDPTLGGSSSDGQAHALYLQDTTKNVIVRRNVMIDNSTEGANLKGGGIAQNNLSLRNPIFLHAGAGNNATIDLPFGVYADLSGNVAIGSNQVAGTSGAEGWGLSHNYGRQGQSQIHHNVAVRSGYTSSGFGMKAGAPNDVLTSNTSWTPPTVPAFIPCYTIFNNNVLYLWNVSGQSGLLDTQNTSSIHATFANNVWDDPTSGTNTNNGSVTFPNAYTETSLLAALGYADETTAINDWIANTPQHGWRNGVTLALAGYGVSQPLSDLSTDFTLTIGIPSSGMFIGTLDGSSLTASGLPTGVTLDSDGRCWRYDGTGTAGTGTCTVTETNGSNNHTTTLNWKCGAQPVLSSLAVTPSATSANATISTNTGSGTLYWMVSGSSTPPNWAEIKVGIDASTTSAAYVFGSQPITATGTQSIDTTTGHTSTALTTGNTYTLHVAQLDANNNPSATSSATFTTVAAWSPASLGSNLALDFTNLSMANLYTDTGATTNVTADGQTVKAIKDPTTGVIATNSTGWVYHANSGKPYLQMDGVSFFATSGNVTYTDGTGQWSAWVAASPGTNGNNTLFLAGSHNMLLANPSLNRTSAIVWSSSAQLAGDNRAGTTINTPAVFAGIVNTTALTVEAFVNGSSDGATSYTGTADTTARSIQIGNTATGPFYGGFIEKALADATTQASAQTYMAALHP